MPYLYKEKKSNNPTKYEQVLLHKCKEDERPKYKPWGKMCATSLYTTEDSNTLAGYPKTYGFCESLKKTIKKPKKLQIKKKSNLNNSNTKSRKNNQKSKQGPKLVIKKTQTKKVIKPVTATSMLPQGRNHELLVRKGEMKEGEYPCKFPFKFARLPQYECIKGRGDDAPNWCATELAEDGKYKTYGYCLDERYKELEDKYKTGKLVNKPKKRIKITKKKNKTMINTNIKPIKEMKATSVLPQGRNHELLVRNGQIKQGEHPCKFPFKYSRLNRAECVEGAKEDAPNWCATEVGDDGKYKTYGYCLDERYKKLKEKYLKGELVNKIPKRKIKITRKKKTLVQNNNSKKNNSTPWIGKFLNRDFSIIETKNNGDCLFDSVYKATGITIKDQRNKLKENITKDIFTLWKSLYENSKKEGNRVILNEFDFMENMENEKKLSEFMMSPDFWANSWAISTIEKEFNIKIVIFDEFLYIKNDLKNVLKCGDMVISNQEPVCQYCNLFKTKYDITKENEHANTLGDHNWVDRDKNETINQDKYVMVSYNLNHYKLISFKDETQFVKLPSIVKDLIIKTCSKKGKLLGVYSNIKNL